MTQPALNTTFDTSLIDLSPTSEEKQAKQQQQNHEQQAKLNQAFPPSTSSRMLTESFSTTDTDSSDQLTAAKPSADASAPPSALHPPPEPPRPSSTNTNQPIRYVSTASAYDAWAPVYDNDGNVLQAVDDLQLVELLPEFLLLVQENIDSGVRSEAQPAAASQPSRPLKIVDFGCGTGRNTLKLLSRQWTSPTQALQRRPQPSIRVVGVDVSSNMLALARKKWSDAVQELHNSRADNNAASSGDVDIKAEFIVHDFLSATTPPPPVVSNADAALSTLVLEHFPQAAFFGALRDIVRIGGLALVTNMHEEMGRVGQAGFVTAEGVKVRGESWVHGTEETVKEARKCGFEVMGRVREKGVEDGMVEQLGKRARKWVGLKVWYGMILKRVE